MGLSVQIVSIEITGSQQILLGGGGGGVKGKLNNPNNFSGYLDINIVVFVNWEPAN